MKTQYYINFPIILTFGFYDNLSDKVRRFNPK